MFSAKPNQTKGKTTAHGKASKSQSTPTQEMALREGLEIVEAHQAAVEESHAPMYARDAYSDAEYGYDVYARSAYAEPEAFFEEDEYVY